MANFKRQPNESQQQYKERLRSEAKAEKGMPRRVLWDSQRRGTYVRAKHGGLG